MSDSDIPDDLVPDSPDVSTDGSQPLSVRNNNPGNMRPVGSATGFDSFDNPQAGYTAMYSDLHGKVTGKSPVMQQKFGKDYTPSISNIINTWAPASDNNNTPAYVSDVAGQLGKDPNDPLTEDDIPALQKAMIAHEGGKKASKYYAAADTGIQSDATVDNGLPADLVPETDLEPEGSDLPGLGAVPNIAQDDSQSIPQLLLNGAPKPDKEQDATNKIIDDYQAGKMSPQLAAYEVIGQGVNKELGGIKDAVGSVIPQSVKNTVSGAVNKVGSAVKDDWDYAKEQAPVTTGAISKIGDAAQEDLDYANEQAPNTMGFINATGNIAKVLPAAKSVEGAVDLGALGLDAAKSAAPVAKDLGRKALDSLPDFIKDEGPGSGAPAAVNLKKAAKAYDPVNTHTAISDSYGAAKAATKPYYDLMDNLAQGETADATGLKPALQSMIDDIQNTPFHEASPQVAGLKAQLAKIGDDNTMPLADMVELKQNLNSNFNPKRFTQAKVATPYSKVGNIVNDSLDDASKRLPQFGEAKSLADKKWINTVVDPFENNGVLQKFWKPEDYYNNQGVKSGLREALPDDTLQRAHTMVDNIQTPVQLNAIRRALPDDLSNHLSGAVIQNITKGNGIGRLDSAAKVVTHGLNPLQIPNTLRNVGNVISPSITQAQKDLIAAAKAAKPSISTAYSQPFNSLKNSVQAGKVINRTNNQIAAGKTAARAANWQNVTAAQQATKQAQTAAMWKQAQPNVKQLLSDAVKNSEATDAESRAATGVGTMDPFSHALKKAGFKKGGLITPQFTHSQWTSYLAKGGRANGHKVADKSNPVAVAAAYKHVSDKNVVELNDRLGRQPSQREVEMAHYVGAGGVHRLLKQQNDKLPAHKMFPKELVNDQKHVFFNKNKPYSVKQLKDVMS